MRTSLRCVLIHSACLGVGVLFVLTGCKQAPSGEEKTGAKAKSSASDESGGGKGSLPIEQYSFAGSVTFSDTCEDMYIDPSEPKAVGQVQATRSQVAKIPESMTFSKDYCPEKNEDGYKKHTSVCRERTGYSSHYRGENWHYIYPESDIEEIEEDCVSDDWNEWIPKAKSIKKNGKKVDIDNLAEKPEVDDDMTLLGRCRRQGVVCTEYLLDMPDPSQKKMLQGPLATSCEMEKDSVSGSFDGNGTCSSSPSYGTCVDVPSLTSTKRYNLDESAKDDFKESCLTGGGKYSDD